ncbi:MAG: hypothetical protein CVT99_03380 [Bacteroidetes bacterium HGW-Bacteroidetes-16]|jgi:hypothetical protein|nr:MAG: hypothetical protein CVT99_03380 [Bacteroidetes bacterium HGW-Bacteroidetes-16]
MKKNLQKATGMVLLMMVVGSAWGQIISQYVETNSGTTPKGIEIWNNTASTLDFSTNNLIIQQGTNGGALADIGSTTIATGTLIPGAVLVIGTSDIGIYLTDQDLTSITFKSYGFSFNGNDALAVKYGGSITDVFGTPTVDPVSAWTGGGVSTANQNISLNSGITTGDLDGWTDPSTRFQTFSTNPSGSGGLVGFGLPPGTSGFWKPNAATTNWATGSNWDDSNVPTIATNVLLPSGASNYPTITAPANCNDITIEDGASLIGAENLTVSGAATMQRSIPAYTTSADGWHLLSSPVNNMAIAGSDFEPGTVSPNLDDFYAFSESTYEWLNYKVGANNITNFVNGTGYLVSYETTSTKDFTGTLNTEDVPFTNLSKTAGKGNGWHLLGNPFQSALHWTNSVITWNPTAIGTGAKILNSGGSYTDVTYDGANQFIPPNQGFFVQATDATNSITIPLDERTHNSTDFYKSPVQNSLTLKASDGEFYVETWIQMMEGATTDFDEQYDVNFLGGMYQAPYFYSIISGEGHLSTNRIAPVNEQTTVPLAFKAFLNREYTITASNASTFGDEIDVILEDTQENIQIDLKDTLEYTFMATADELTERFVVHFFNVTGISETTHPESVRIYSYGNRVYLRSELNTYGDVTVYNMLAQKVYNSPVELSGLQSFSVNLNKGWFVVQVVTTQGVKSKKVFIN